LFHAKGAAEHARPPGTIQDEPGAHFFPLAIVLKFKALQVDTLNFSEVNFSEVNLGAGVLRQTEQQRIELAAQHLVAPAFGVRFYPPPRLSPPDRISSSAVEAGAVNGVLNTQKLE
jgi:hypothetical protein